MPAWAYTLTSINGTAIVGGSVASAYFRVANGPGSTQGVGVVQATVPGKGSADVRGQPLPAVWRLAVNLSGVNQTDLAALHALFDPEDGLVYLRVTDGASVVWRTAVRTIGIEQVNTLQFDVVLSAPNPVWEEDTITTNSQLNQQASPIAINLTNNGTRKARPVITVTADAAKSLGLDDYAWSLQGFLVNRAPNDIVDKPVYLFDSAAAAARLATNTSATGATVLQTTGLTSITVDITAGATTITLASAAGWPASGMGFLTDSRGAGFHDQFYYTSIAGAVLQGVIWLPAAANGGSSNPGAALQTAGGIAHTQAQETGIQPSGVMLSGDDCRVWLDDVGDIDRWLVAWNGAASDVVINVSLPRGIALTLAAALTAGVPANGGAISFNEDVSSLPPKGFLALENEIIYFASRAGRQVSGIVRACWGTTAATHAVNATAWANPRRYVVGAGYAKAGAPPAPAARRPCIQLPASSNQAWRYGDQSDDTSTIYFERTTPDRTAQWVPRNQVDGNISVPIRLDASGNILTFKDDDVGNDTPAFNRLDITIPQGIDNVASAVTNDWTPADNGIMLELFGRDGGGTDKRLDLLMQSAAVAARQSGTTAAILYQIGLKARYALVTAQADKTTAVATIATSAANLMAQQFTLDQATRIYAINLPLSVNSIAQDVIIEIFEDSSNAPNVSGAGRWKLSKSTITIPNTQTTATWTRVTLPPNFTLPAGKFWIVVYLKSAFSAIVTWWGNANFAYSRGIAAISTDSGANWTTLPDDFAFEIISAYERDGVTTFIQSDQPRSTAAGARVGTTVSFDKTILTIEPTQAVYVHRVTAFVTGATAGSLLHCVPVIANTTTGDSITIDKWMKPTSTLAIDCDQRTVVYTEDTVEYPVTKCCTFGNTADWLALVAGANALTWTEASLLAPGQVDVVTTYRGVKA